MKTPDQVVEIAVEAVKHARKKFPLVQWSAEDAFRSDPEFLSHELLMKSLKLVRQRLIFQILSAMQHQLNTVHYLSI